mmetsp:Transcript_25/g.72  ORF Transcript_25/g.72 Transcript_25/m.72 type:complete len:256 (+) Transcript_25:592-1359(+)
MLLEVQSFDHVIDALVLLDQLQSALLSNALDGAAVVTPHQDAQVNELRHVDPQPLQHSIQRDLHDRDLARFGDENIAKHNRSPEGQGVHILRDCGVDNASLGEYSALRLGLCGSFNHRHSHQSQQRLGVFRHLPGHAHSPLRKFLHSLIVALLTGFRKRCVRLLPFLLAIIKGALFQVGRLAVKDIHRLYVVLEHLGRTHHEAVEVARHFAGVVGQHVGAVRPLHGDQELIHGHRSIDGHFAAEVGPQVDFLGGC